MKKELKMVEEFHKKFKRPISHKPIVHLISEEQSFFRYHLMKEEVNEYMQGVKKGDLENVAKELADIMYTVYGTVIEHGLQNKMEKVFEEVHESNMSKEIKEGHQKLYKGKNYFEADIKQFFRSNE